MPRPGVKVAPFSPVGECAGYGWRAPYDVRRAALRSAPRSFRAFLLRGAEEGESMTEEQRNNGAAAISNEMTKLHRERYGRGPNSVRTVVGHDHVICFLEDLYTPAARTPLDAGDTGPAVEMPPPFPRAMEERLTPLV